MTRIDEFLAYYKDYESLLRDNGYNAKDVEDESDEFTGARLRMCRMFRNYLSHQNDPGFLDISDTQLKFIKERLNSLVIQGDILKKHLKTAAAGVCSDKDKCCDAVVKMAKLKTENVVVTMASGYGVVSIFDVTMAALASKTNKVGSLKYKKNYILMPPETLMSDVPKDRIVICTSDGKETGKLVGVMYP